MGQFNATASGSRVTFDEEGDNGLVLCDRYLPVEVLIEILCRADCKTLLSCQLVCKRWKMLMRHVWHKKTERTLARPFPWSDDMSWSVFYLACAKKPYERNLLRNHSGADSLRHWKCLLREGHANDWVVEEPPVGVPELPPAEPLFKDRQICFATSFAWCNKAQTVVLAKEGVHPYILDTYQPPIVVSEWYSCRWDCPAVYQLEVRLYNSDNLVMDTFEFNDVLEGEKQNQWLKVSHVFENYGPGLDTIYFEHRGKDRAFWAGNYGSKMAGACVYVKIPGQ
ncbi:PREDICTED: F-box only protein 27-like [Vollenhovia emeryi]|uniref:F-box only protein 27-like n=1 Tax=Vollenhovia emeryi TaxID=411798 RepID=UPI0005F384BD|nr:PREDICTED: F-box only protein 27-like [Vollenhovia emeryi]XP_011876834.1 PREDICTED: F-box only protein 27-like [Vollenhovia emeryi]XP_011876835.1 PREDICTED: F-box only protein 27-like [Vollenhovia emeryi]